MKLTTAIELAESALWVGLGLFLIGASFGQVLKRKPRNFAKAKPCTP